jgi:hypothetical protein
MGSTRLARQDGMRPAAQAAAASTRAADGLENQQVQRSLHQIAWFTHTIIIYDSYCR